MTVGIQSFGIPRQLAKVMGFLRWADYPNCQSLADYRGDAQRFMDLKARVERGREVRDMVRRGP